MGDDSETLIFAKLGVRCKIIDEGNGYKLAVMDHSEEAHRVRSLLISNGHSVGDVELSGPRLNKWSVRFDVL